ncbi:hypothetical protein [Peribacillus asahii]|uniref:hypothetical protein n=1 Tax=Peribacillus asahii TaxID=228899 RepID=UPI003810C73F
MSEESNEKAKSQRELLRENNGWELYTNAEFSLWDNDHNYLIVDEELDTVFAFYF